MQVGGYAKALQDAGCVALGLPAAKLGVLLLQPAGEDAVRVGHFLLGVERFLFPADFIEARVAHDDGIHDRVLVAGVLVLFQNRHSYLGQDGYRAAGGVQLPGENVQKGGFSRAVGADDAVTVAAGKLKVDVGEQNRAAVLEAEVAHSDHGITPQKK